MHLGSAVEVEEPCFDNGPVGSIEILRHGRQHVFDFAVAAGVDLIAANDDQLGARGFRVADQASRHDDFFEPRVFALGSGQGDEDSCRLDCVPKPPWTGPGSARARRADAKCHSRH